MAKRAHNGLFDRWRKTTVRRVGKGARGGSGKQVSTGGDVVNGHKLWRGEDGCWRVPSIDRENCFESKGEAARFVRAWVKGVANPKQKLYTDISVRLQDAPPDADGVVKGNVVHVGQGVPVEILATKGKRVLAHGDYLGNQFWGWLDKERLVNLSKFVAAHGWDPTGKQNPMSNPEGIRKMTIQEITEHTGTMRDGAVVVSKVKIDQARKAQKKLGGEIVDVVEVGGKHVTYAVVAKRARGKENPDDRGVPVTYKGHRLRLVPHTPGPPLKQWGTLLTEDGQTYGSFAPHREDDAASGVYRYGGKDGSAKEVKLARGKKSNPVEAADEMYEKFHGRPSGETVEVRDVEHYHGRLAALGVLVEMKVRTVSGYRVELGFASDVAEGHSNPQKWILPKKRWKKNYEDVGYMPFALEHDIGLSGSKMYRPVKVSPDGSITVGSTELHSVEFDRYSRKSAIDAIKKLAGGKANPKASAEIKAWLKRRGKAIGGYGDKIYKTFINPNEAEASEFYKPGDRLEFNGTQYIVERAVDTPESANYSYIVKRPKGDTKYVAWVYAHGEKHRGKVFAVDSLGAWKKTQRNPDHDTSGYTILAINEKGDQLYIEGGDQSLDLKAIHMDGKWERDSMVIGDIEEITYRTQKDFDKFATIDYFHKLGEKTRVMPELIYDTMNQRLHISGGQYFVKKPMFGTSPGLEN